MTKLGQLDRSAQNQGMEIRAFYMAILPRLIGEWPSTWGAVAGAKAVLG